MPEEVSPKNLGLEITIIISRFIVHFLRYQSESDVLKMVLTEILSSVLEDQHELNSRYSIETRRVRLHNNLSNLLGVPNSILYPYPSFLFGCEKNDNQMSDQRKIVFSNFSIDYTYYYDSNIFTVICVLYTECILG